MQRKTLSLILVSLLMAALSACNGVGGASSSQALTASGFIAADHIRIAPEISGKVLSIQVAEGDTVQAGDVLFSLDDELLQGQAKQAQAAVDLAQVSLEAANAQLASVQVQYTLTVQQARLGDQQGRATAWTVASPDAFKLPVWYFEKSEQLAAVQAEVADANKALDTELASLAQELQQAGNQPFIAAETRLAQAQVAYTIADQTLKQAQAARDQQDLENAAQEQLDAAQAELEAAQLAYDRLLSTSAAQSVLEARARVAVARARLDMALDTLTSLQTGTDSLQVAAAQAAVTQAQTAVTQATANRAQAQAALDLVNLQLQRCVVKAPAAGTVLALNVQVGELISAGSTVLTLGQLNELKLTVYVPEDQYGKVKLGQQVSVAVDSFPGQSFTGVVSAIADEAEFTPRNVQTVEGRQSTVYAIEIAVANPDQTLKPGMPADVDF
jgi:multidrug resistance efflux pump